MKKTLSVLLVLSLLAAMLSGCCYMLSYPAPEIGETVVTDAPYVSETHLQTLPGGVSPAPETDLEALANENLAALPSENMNEISFFILTIDASRITPDEEAEEEVGRRIDSEILRRNQMVEEKYNVRLLTTEYNEDILVETVRGALRSGQYLADLLEIPYRLLGEFADKKLSYNMNTLPFTDYSASYFDQETIDQCSAGYYIYAVSGNANRYVEAEYCVYFNQSYFPQADLYQDVRGGEWTWERLLSLRGERPILLPEGLEIAELALSSSKAHMLTTAYAALPEATQKEEVQSAAILASAIADASATTPDASAFCEGQTPFYLGTLSEYRAMARLPFDWGILPIPNLKSGDTSYNTLSTHQTLFTAVRTMASPERTGMILQALNAATVGQVKQVIVQDALLTVAQSSEVCNMIERLGDGLFYDFGYMMSPAYDSIRRATTDSYYAAVAGEKTFAEGYADAERNLIYWNPRNFEWD